MCSSASQLRDRTRAGALTERVANLTARAAAHTVTRVVAIATAIAASPMGRVAAVLVAMAMAVRTASTRVEWE